MQASAAAGWVHGIAAGLMATDLVAAAELTATIPDQTKRLRFSNKLIEWVNKEHPDQFAMVKQALGITAP